MNLRTGVTTKREGPPERFINHTGNPKFNTMVNDYSSSAIIDFDQFLRIAECAVNCCSYYRERTIFTVTVAGLRSVR